VRASRRSRPQTPSSSVLVMAPRAVLASLLPSLLFDLAHGTAAPPLPCNGQAEEEIHVSVRGDASDAFQYKKTGITYSGSSGEIYVGRSAYHGNVVSALRFTDVKVPKDARIISASVRLVDAHAGTVCCKGKELAVLLRLEKAAQSTPLPRHQTPGWLLSKLSMTPSKVWQPPATDTFNATETPDLSEMVQSVVRLDGWTQGNAMTLLMDGEGEVNDVDERVYFGSAATFQQHRAMLSIRFCRAPPAATMAAEIAPMCPPAPACPKCSANALRASSDSASARGMLMMADSPSDAEAAPASAGGSLLAGAGTAVALAAAAVAVTLTFVAGTVRCRQRCSIEDEFERCLADTVDHSCGGDTGL